MSTSHQAFAGILLLIGVTSGVSGQTASPIAKSRSSAEQQKAIELVAARAVAQQLKEVAKAATLALDPRLYSSYLDHVQDPPAKFENLPQPVSELAPSRGEDHLRELAAVLNINAHVDDRSSCVTPRLSGCRIGARGGVVAFSPALLRGDSAFVAVTLAQPVAPIRGRSARKEDNVGWKIWSLTLVAETAKGGSAPTWRVVGTQVISAY